MRNLGRMVAQDGKTRLEKVMGEEEDNKGDLKDGISPTDTASTVDTQVGIILSEKCSSYSIVHSYCDSNRP